MVTLNVSKKSIHKYRKLLIINKTNIENKRLDQLIKIAMPDKVKNKKITLFVLNKGSYKKELKKIKLLNLIPKHLIPFAGLSFTLDEKTNGRFITKPVVVVLVERANRMIYLTGDKNKGYLRMIIRSQEELFITILSHELKHVAYGEITMNNAKEESLCDRYAIRRVKAYRRMKK